MFEPKERKTRSDKKIDGRVEAHLAAILCRCPSDGKPKWQLKMLSEELIELEVVEHIRATMVHRLIKNELKPFQKKQWVIPAEKSAAFVYQTEQVLSGCERPYDAEYPLVCMDESPKQIIDYRQ